MIKKHSLLRRHPSILPTVQLTTDCLTSVLTMLFFTEMKNGGINMEYRSLAILSTLLMVFVYHYSGQYSHNRNLFSEICARTRAWLFVIALLLFIGFISKGMHYYSREVLLLWASTALALQLINYVFFLELTSQFRKKHKKQQPAIIIGASQSGRKLIQAINNNVWLNHKIIGYVDQDPDREIEEAPYLGDIESLDFIIKQHGIKHIYITIPIEQLNMLGGLYFKLMQQCIDLHWVPDISSLHMVNHHVKEISGLPILTLSESPLIAERLILKSAFDTLLSLLILIAISPLMVAIAITIKLSSPGPVLFTQERHGWNNKVFRIYKFRSMKLHQEQDGQITQARKNDDRVTTVGRFIRRTSIDELPQLFNVIKGDMSLVGPRPHALVHNDYYQRQINGYLSRHKIKPGITGLAQISGYRGETDTLDKMIGRVNQDIHYINNWSLLLDIEILFKTAFTLLTEEAY